MMMAKGLEATSEDERETARIYRAGINAFLSVKATMPAQLINTFLLVLEEPGLPVTEYAAKLGMAQNVMTRHLLDLGSEGRNHEQGLGLIVQKVDAVDARRKLAYLTPKGRAVASQLTRTLVNVKRLRRD
jgi:DNA-binding MarR family transcriptional regulator